MELQRLEGHWKIFAKAFHSVCKSTKKFSLSVNKQLNWYHKCKQKADIDFRCKQTADNDTKIKQTADIDFICKQTADNDNRCKQTADIDNKCKQTLEIRLHLD